LGEKKKNMVRNVAMIWKPHFEQVKFDEGFGHQKMMTGVRICARHAHPKMSSFWGSGPSLMLSRHFLQNKPFVCSREPFIIMVLGTPSR